MAAAAEGLSHDIGGVILVGDVAGNRDGVTTLFFDPGRALARHSRQDVRTDNLGAFGGQAPRQRPADIGTGPGDDRHLAFQSPYSCLLA